MIKLLKTGRYQLIETKHQNKILTLDSNSYVWIVAENIGELLVSTIKNHREACVLSQGGYRLYDVKEEPHLADLQHLELFVGEGLWQGYLLLNGLPTEEEKQHRIIPTNEVITECHK